MNIELVINNGTSEDMVVMKNILNTYDVRTINMNGTPQNNEMGTEFVATLILLLPEICEFTKTIVPAIETYFKVKKPTGTKHEIVLINGEKKIQITHEDGKKIDMDEMVKFCNETEFFE